MITIDGETLPLREWLRQTGRSINTFNHRVARGLSEKEAIFGKFSFSKNNTSALKHGHTSRNGIAKPTPEYRAWEGAKQRCTNQACASFANYGGRGIEMCPEWLTSFEAFLAAVGLRPSNRHSIGRIDNDGDYVPSNVEWQTPEQQRRNTRSNHVVTALGKTMILTEWAHEVGIPIDTLWRRLVSWGWSPDRAVTEPVRPKCPRIQEMVHAAGYNTVSDFLSQHQVSVATLYKYGRGASVRPATKALLEKLLGPR